MCMHSRDALPLDPRTARCGCVWVTGCSGISIVFTAATGRACCAVASRVRSVIVALRRGASRRRSAAWASALARGPASRTTTQLLGSDSVRLWSRATPTRSRTWHCAVRTGARTACGAAWHGEAQCSLGLFYALRRGVTQDGFAAAPWLREASAQHHERSRARPRSRGVTGGCDAPGPKNSCAGQPQVCVKSDENLVCTRV